MLQFTEFFNVNYLTEAGMASGYSDEHAFVHVWNHAVNNGYAQNKNKMHKEIDKAKNDPSHKLHINNIPKEGFIGGDKKNSSPEKYYQELHHAADTIHDVANHPDFKGTVKYKHQASIVSANQGKVADSWKAHGAKNATSKADIKIGENHKISYKKRGNSQLMSGETSEVKATYHHAAGDMVRKGKITPEQHREINDHIETAANHIEAIKSSKNDVEREEHKRKAQESIDEAHKVHPQLINHVHHEAASGKQKFGGGEGSATHVLTSYNEKKGAATINSIEHYHDSTHKLSHPRVAKPKGFGRPGNLKIDIRG